MTPGPRPASPPDTLRRGARSPRDGRQTSGAPRVRLSWYLLCSCSACAAILVSAVQLLRVSAARVPRSPMIGQPRGSIGVRSVVFRPAASDRMRDRTAKRMYNHFRRPRRPPCSRLLAYSCRPRATLAYDRRAAWPGRHRIRRARLAPGMVRMLPGSKKATHARRLY